MTFDWEVKTTRGWNVNYQPTDKVTRHKGTTFYMNVTLVMALHSRTDNLSFAHYTVFANTAMQVEL